MKQLLIVISLLIFIGCTHNPRLSLPENCLNRAILLCEQHPNAVIKYGITANNIAHVEAVWVKDNIEYPVDGTDTIIKTIPQNKYLKYYTKDEAIRKWVN